MSFNVIGVKDGHKKMEFVRLAREARERAEQWRAQGFQDVHVVSCEGGSVIDESLKALERAESPWTGRSAA